MTLFEPFTIFTYLQSSHCSGLKLGFAAFSYKSSPVALIPTNQTSVLTLICFHVPLLLSNISSSSNIHKGKAIDS